MPTYLVTGAFGHLGSFVVRRLLREPDATVYALARGTSSRWRLHDTLDAANLRVLSADLNDMPTVRSVLASARADTLLHCAWEGVTGAARNDTGQITRNITASLALFEAGIATGMRTFVGIGSQAEYGAGYTAPRTETMPPRPDTAYGVAKTCVQQATAKMAELAGVRYLWARVFSLYGPQDDARHLLPTLICALLRRECPALTPGEQTWDYLHVADCADALAALLHAPNASGVYNIAAGQSVALRRVIEQVRDAIDPALPLGFGEVPYRPDQVMRLEADTSRFAAATAWKPSILLADGLRETVEYYRRYPTPEGEVALTPSPPLLQAKEGGQIYSHPDRRAVAPDSPTVPPLSLAREGVRG